MLQEKLATVVVECKNSFFGSAGGLKLELADLRKDLDGMEWNGPCWERIKKSNKRTGKC
jgi:hypothetical protein